MDGGHPNAPPQFTHEATGHENYLPAAYITGSNPGFLESGRHA
jgi:hypothetical protein